MEDEREVTVGLLRSLAENYKKGQLSDPQRGKVAIDTRIPAFLSLWYVCGGQPQKPVLLLCRF